MDIHFENIDYNLPDSYIDFLKSYPDGLEVVYDETEKFDHDNLWDFWDLMGVNELKESWEMWKVGTAINYQCLAMYIKCYQEIYGREDVDSPEGKLPASRVANGFVIATYDGDYIYLDPSDNFSVWKYHHDGSDVERMSQSFDDWLGRTKSLDEI